jgi:hypothetical protein
MTVVLRASFKRIHFFHLKAAGGLVGPGVLSGAARLIDWIWKQSFFPSSEEKLNPSVLIGVRSSMLWRSCAWVCRSLRGNSPV